MRKITQKLAFLLLALWCCVGVQVKADELTVNDGTSTNAYVPIYGYFADMGVRSQFIVPAEDISEIDGGTINGLTFYAASNFSFDFTGTWSVKLMETEEESVSSSYVDVSSAEVAFSGHPSVSGGVLTIELATPFDYEGGNLLIDFTETSNGNYSSSGALLWYGVSTGTSCGGNSASSQSFLPKVTFEYAAGGSGPVCKKPSLLEASEISENEATLSWDGESGFFTVAYKAASADEWITELESSPLTTTVLSDLQPNTAYEARVIGVCGEQVSGEKTISFRTACGIYSVATSGAYEEDFESYPATAAATNNGTSFGCWETGSSTGTYIPHVANSGSYGYYPHSGSKCLSFYGSGYCYAALPIFADELNTLRISFWVKMENTSNGVLTLGYLTSTDPGDWSSYQVLTTYTSVSSLTQYETYLDTIPAEAARLVFRWYYSGQYSCAIDDIKVSRIPTCLKPINLAVVPGSVAKNSIQLTWEDTTPAAEWKIQYKKSGAADWTTIDANANPFEISGLEAFTTYSVRVASVCDPSDALDGTSEYSDEFSFKTAAGVPFAESFNKYSMPAGWNKKIGLWDIVSSDPDSLLATSSGWTTSSTLNGVFPDSTYHLKLNIYGENCKYWLISPTIEVAASQQLTFDMALTKSSGSLSPVTVGEQNDDKFIVLLSADGGQSWEELYVRDNVSSADGYDQIACSANGEFVAIDLSSYASEKIQIAFYGESTEEGGDNYLHIANVNIDAIPLCTKPSQVLVSEIHAESAMLSWDEGDASAWVVQYSKNADFTDSIEVAVNDEATLALSALTPEAKYYVRVKAVCDGDAESAWSASVSFVPTDAISMTINEGTSTNGAVPIQGYYVDELSNSQFIIPASSLTDALWGSIKRLTFYAGSDVSWGDAAFEVYMSEIPSTTISELADWSSMTKVMDEASLAVEDKAMVVDLTNFYQYQGGNLLIGIKQTVEGTWSSVSWSGISATGASLGGHAGTASQQNFLPKMTIAYIPGEQPDCIKPANLEAVLTYGDGTIATLKWESSSATEFVLQYAKNVDFADSIEVELNDVDSINLTGLTPETKYYARIKSICSTDSESEWSDVVSFTPTNAVAVTINNGTTTNGYVPIYGLYVDEGVGSQFIIPADSLTPVQWGKINQLTFHANEANINWGAKFNVYLAVTDSATISDFVTWNDLTLVASSATLVVSEKQMVVKLDAPYEYFGGNLLVGFAQTVTGSWASSTWYGIAATGASVGGKTAVQQNFLPKMTIDYIPGEEPDCYKASGLALSEITISSVKATWDDVEDGAWKYAVALASAGEPADDAFISIANDTVVVEDLTDNSDYIFYLRQDCGESVSESILKAFHTKQLPVAAPFADDFENGNNWNLINGEIQNAWVLGEATHNGEGTHALYISKDNGATNTYATSANAMVYAVKAFSFTTGIYSFKYDWKSKGEKGYDYLRVALVPDSIELVASESVLSGLSASALPTGWVALDGGSQLSDTSIWISQQSAEIEIEEGVYNVVFAWRNDYSTGTNPPAAVDNFAILKIACQKPTGLAIDSITASGAFATWDAVEDGAWEYAYAAADAAEPTEFTAVADTFVAISGLEQNTEYIFYLRQDCGEDGLSQIVSAQFRTKQLPVAVPFADDFENGNNWLFFNGTAENAWVLDTAAHNGEGTHALYISNDNGVHNAYSNNKTALVYAAKAFSFEQGSYIFNYEWRANGENYSDYLRVALVPDSIDFEAGSISSTSLPTGWTALDGGSKLNLKTVWDTISTEEITVAEGIYNVVFVWKNDGSAGTNPPAAIDNFSIAEVACPMQSDLDIPKATITDSSAKIFWTKGNPNQDAWQIAFDTIARFVPDSAEQITILDVDTIPYELTGLVANKTYYVSVRAKCGENEFSKWLPRKSFKTAKSCQTPDGLAVSQISDTAAVINWNTYGQTEFNLRYGIDTVWIETIENVTMPYTLNGLDANTSYKVQVQVQCDLTKWSSSKTFKTACEIISALPWDENFDAMTASTIPDCWDNSASSTSTTGEYVWGVYSYSSNKMIRMNNYWVQNGSALINTPTIELPAAPASEVSFDYSNRASCGDLKLKVSVDGTNWTELQSFAQTSASYDYSNPGAFTEAVVDLSDYAGQSIMLQFYAEANYGEGAIFVDNVSIHAIPSCKKTSAPAIDSIAPHAALISWTLTDTLQTAWQIAYDTVARFVPDSAEFITIVDADTTSYLLEGLDHETTYFVAVRANCGEGDYSVWSAVKSFTTAIACHVPDSLEAVLTPGDGSIATLNWTAGASENAWVLQYSENADFSDSIEVEVNDAPTASLTALTPETKYYARVKAVCGGIDGESRWSAAISFIPTDAFFFTINDSTNTSDIVPVYGYWADNYSRSQFIIPEADLASIQWDSITQLTFYASQANLSWDTAKFEVYMAEAQEMSISELADWDALNNVKAAGSLSVAGGKMIVALDAPYQYQGGNLLIGFKQTVRGGYMTSTWYGKTAEGASMGGYENTSGSVNVSQRNFLPKMTIFHIHGEIPACDAPTELNASDIFENEATLSWTSDASAWQLVYSENADFDPNEATPLDVQKPYVLGNLLAQTTYYYYVRTNCGHGNFSAWSAKGSFATAAPCVTKYAEAVYDSLCLGGSYEWQGMELSEPGTYFDTLQAVDHCDSILTLHLAYYAAEDTIYDATQIAADELPFKYKSEEHPYIGQDSIFYPAGTPLGIYYDTVLVVGEHCTAVLVHELTIERCEVEGETTEVELCPGEGYEWKGQIIGEAGTYYDTIPSAAGCDSIETLVLSFYEPEDTIFIDLTILKDSLPFTYVNEEHPYITGEAPLYYPEGTSIGLHHDTAYVEGEHCTAVLVLNLKIEESQDIDNIFGRDGKGAQKVIYRDIMYIIINDEWYSAAGQKVDDPRK